MSEASGQAHAAKVNVIHQLQHAAQRYRVITSGEEIIERTGEQIVRACQLQMNAAAWRQNFDLAVELVAKWSDERAQRVAMVLVDLRSDKVVFYVVPQSEHFDFQLGDEQAELDIELNTRGGIGYSETRQIPAWELDRFVSDTALLVWQRPK